LATAGPGDPSYGSDSLAWVDFKRLRGIFWNVLALVDSIRCGFYSRAEPRASKRGNVEIPGRKDILDRQASFRQLVDAHYESLLNYGQFLLGSASEAEDVVHQAFLLAFDRLSEGEAFEGDAAKWLRGTARNLVCGVWRQKRKLPQDLAELILDVVGRSEEGGESLDRRRLREALEECLKRLEPGDRELIAERYEQGGRITRIAERLKFNVATVRVRLFRIRQGLKSCVEARFAGEVPL
jgi:RNA polymerase sigma-70 factor (ECF subfamily)